MALTINTTDGTLLLAAANGTLYLTLARTKRRHISKETTRLDDEATYRLRMALDAHLDRRHTP